MFLSADEADFLILSDCYYLEFCLWAKKKAKEKNQNKSDQLTYYKTLNKTVPQEQSYPITIFLQYDITKIITNEHNKEET